MEDTGWLNIHFMDGSVMRFDFVRKDIDYVSLAETMDKAAESNKLVLDVEGVLYIFPYSSIKYMRVSPSPDILPDIAVRDVRLAE